MLLSNRQIAFALGGKVHGDTVLAPGPGRGPDESHTSAIRF
jgi:hypothetical protein